MLIISDLNGINHETVSKPLFIFYFLHIPLHTIQSSCSTIAKNKYWKSFIHMSSTAPIVDYLEGHAGKQVVAGSIPGGGIHYHLNFRLYPVNNRQKNNIFDDRSALMSMDSTHVLPVASSLDRDIGCL